MGKTSYAVKLEDELQRDLKEFCDSRGFKQGSFVEKAVREKMEREDLAEDLLDLFMLRPTEPHSVKLEDYLKRHK